MKYVIVVGVMLSFEGMASEIASLETISVFGQNPLFSEHNTTSIIGSTQTISAEELAKSNALSLSQHMKNRLTSVHINDVQNNPFQPDALYVVVFFFAQGNNIIKLTLFIIAVVAISRINIITSVITVGSQSKTVA